MVSPEAAPSRSREGTQSRAHAHWEALQGLRGMFAEYPFKAPEVKFVTACYHPNVDQHGNICLDILKEKWSAAYSVRTLLLSIQSLLGTPPPPQVKLLSKVRECCLLKCAAAQLPPIRSLQCIPLRVGQTSPRQFQAHLEPSPCRWPGTSTLNLCRQPIPELL